MRWSNLFWLLGSLAFSAVCAGQSPPTVTGLPAWGVQLVWAGGPAAAAIYQSRYASLLSEPRLTAPSAGAVILLNQTAKVIAGYKLRWDYRLANGATRHGFLQYAEMGLMDGAGNPAGEGASILPGGFHVVSRWINASPENVETALTQAENSRAGHPISPAAETVAGVTLDGVLFADGTFVGPDTGHFVDAIQEGRAADHDVGVLVQQADDAGVTDQELAQDLQKQIAANGKSRSPLGTPQQFYQSEQVLQVRYLLALLNASGRQAVDTRARALAKEQPYPITKLPPSAAH